MGAPPPLAVRVVTLVALAGTAAVGFALWREQRRGRTGAGGPALLLALVTDSLVAWLILLTVAAPH